MQNKFREKNKAFNRERVRRRISAAKTPALSFSLYTILHLIRFDILKGVHYV
jgi:hypothetical protein